MNLKDELRRRLAMRRRLRNSAARKMKNISREDCICAAYYLYCASELDEYRKYPSDGSVELFCKLVTFFGRTADQDCQHQPLYHYGDLSGRRLPCRILHGQEDRDRSEPPEAVL